MAATTSGPVTFADLEKMPDSDGRYELHHGELIKLPPPKHRHYRIQHRLRTLLEGAGGPGVVEIGFGFRALPENEYRIADVAFVTRERWDRISPDGYLEGAPDIVIEVLSPSNSAVETLDKEKLCLENGAIEFWVVDPTHNHVKVSTHDGHSRIWKSGQQIPLFFGGSIAIDEIFRN